MPRYRDQSPILLVGSHSFLASRFLALSQRRGALRTASHNNVFESGNPRDARLVVNFAIHPEYRVAPYNEDIDFDLRLARSIAGHSTRYVMLSTRAVYPEERAFPASEDTPAIGFNAYGRNKAETEHALTDLLGDRLTVLRIANVMGYEAGRSRRTFMGMALDRLRETGEIQLDIAPNVRRDFIPDDRFVAALDAVIDNPAPGALNVGSGVPCQVGDIAQWLIQGFGSGKIVITSNRQVDEFVLDVSRLNENYGVRTSREDIRAFCIELGRRLSKDATSRSSPD